MNQQKAAAASYQPEKRLKKLLGTIQLLSPTLAYKIALKAFFTPINYPTPEREKPFSSKCIISKETVGGKEITLYQMGEAEKSLLLVHGWSGRASQFYAMAPVLSKLGYQVFAFTAPAHGSSADRQTHMLEFADCIAYLDKKQGPFEAIIAHSIGGAAVLNAIKHGVKTKKVVLLGVPGYITAIVHDFCAKLGLNQKVNSKLMSHLNHKYHGDVERFSTTRLAAEMTIPALIIHDIDDFDVPIAYARQNHTAWNGSILEETKGLGHRKILSDKAVIEKISTFLGSLAND